MRGFLEEVAADLYARYGDALSERAVLFPSRRARLFFTDALARIVRRPMWQPAWTTVDELMAEISGLETADRVRLVTELYKVYSAFHDEPFDKFYFWGDMLLADFDTIDKYRVDARQLFRNLHEIKEIEADISYLTPRQLQILNFWSSLGPEADLSAEKRRFLAIWKTLHPIYERFRERLTELGIAYNGMVQRAAADRIRAGGFVFAEPRRFVAAGFNALTECEKELFRFLAAQAETDFYWDYDTYYMDDAAQEAGMFVRRNAADFPMARAGGCGAVREAGSVFGGGTAPASASAMPCPVTHDHLSRPKEVTAVTAVSNAVQCKYAAEILRQLLAERRRKEGPAARLGKETAVVLTDENLLLPLLYALPPEIGRVNVTMGFPLRATLAYTFVERLVELQAHRRRKGDGWTFYHADAEGLLAHPYVAGCDAALTRELLERIVAERRISVEGKWLGGNDFLRMIFCAAEDWRAMSDYLLRIVAEAARRSDGEDARERREYLAVIAEEITKLRNSLEECDLDLSTEVYASLLRRHLQTLRIPFEGEPLEGVQIMGILETRSLDFEHVVLLSMNDDNFPGNRTAQGSFVPYNLRAAFSLPTPEHHEGVYAYYFYRLIQRARTVHLLYCAHADEKSTGEPSRYIRQLDYESPIQVRKVEVGVDVNLAQTDPIEVRKDARVMASLERFVDPESRATLSPTAFFRYVACPLRFYFHSVARLETPDEVSEEIDAPMFGTILHAAAQALYTPLAGEHRPGETLRAMLRTDAVAEAVGRAINEHFLRDAGADTEEYTGNLLLVKDIVERYLRGGVMPYDAEHDGFTVCGLEEKIAYGFAFRTGGEDNAQCTMHNAQLGVCGEGAGRPEQPEQSGTGGSHGNAEERTGTQGVGPERREQPEQPGVGPECRERPNTPEDRECRASDNSQFTIHNSQLLAARNGEVEETAGPAGTIGTAPGCGDAVSVHGSGADDAGGGDEAQCTIHNSQCTIIGCAEKGETDETAGANETVVAVGMIGADETVGKVPGCGDAVSVHGSGADDAGGGDEAPCTMHPAQAGSGPERGGRMLRMKFAGIADRIDRLDDGTLRVVDYKTSAPHLDFAGVESLFRGEGKQRLSNILQTLLYAMMLHRTRGVEVEPALYYVRSMNRADYSPQLEDRELGRCGVRYSLYAERFERLVAETLAELYDPAVPFRQCADADTCRFCDFNVICKR